MTTKTRPKKPVLVIEGHSQELFFAHRHSLKIVRIENEEVVLTAFSTDDEGGQPLVLSGGFEERIHKDRLLATLAWVVKEAPDMPLIPVPQANGLPMEGVDGLPIMRRDDSQDQVICSISRVSSMDTPRRDLGRLLATTRLEAALTPPASRSKGQQRLMAKTRIGYVEDKVGRKALRDWHIVTMNKVKFIEQFLHHNPFFQSGAKVQTSTRRALRGKK